MNADGSDFHRIGADGAFIDADPAWSPDGSQVVFTAGGGDAIDIIDADGSNRHRLVTKSEARATAISRGARTGAGLRSNRLVPETAGMFDSKYG